MEKAETRRGGGGCGWIWNVGGAGGLAGITEAPTNDHVGQEQVPAEVRDISTGSKNRPAALWPPYDCRQPRSEPY